MGALVTKDMGRAVGEAQMIGPMARVSAWIRLIKILSNYSKASRPNALNVHVTGEFLRFISLETREWMNFGILTVL